MTLPPPTLTEIGRRALQRRKALDLTQKEAARRAERSPGWISRLENAKSGMRVEDLIRLSVALRMPATELLMGADTRTLVEQVGEIPAPADVAGIFRRIAGCLGTLADDDRDNVVQGLGILANALERMSQR